MFSSKLEDIFSLKNLKKSYSLISKNTIGLDEVSISFFEKDLQENLEDLISDIQNHTFSPEPLKRIYIPKETNAELRPIGLGSLKDKLVQKTIALSLGAYFEGIFSDKSYGYRTHKSTYDAIRRVKNYIKTSHIWVYSIDIDMFFDTIPHDRLLRLLDTHIQDKRIIELIALFVHNGSFEQYKYLQHAQGVHQGDPLSPLLANIYLHQLDLFLETSHIPFVRFADDVVIFAKNRDTIDAYMSSIHTHIQSLQLLLNGAKSKKSHIIKEGFSFLGITFKNQTLSIEKQKFAQIQQKLQYTINSTYPFSDMIEALNQQLGGLKQYYFKLLDENHPQFMLIQDTLLLSLANRVTKERKRGSITTKKAFMQLLDEINYPQYMKKTHKQDFIKRIIARGYEAYLSQKTYKKSYQKIEKKKKSYTKRYATSSVLYVSEIGTFLGVAKNSIVLKQKGKTILKMPNTQCERIIIASRSVSLSVALVQVCANLGIAIDFIDPHAKTPPYASIYGHKNAYAKMTIKQLQILNTPMQMKIAKAFIKGKVKNQINYLKYLDKYHKQLQEPIKSMEHKLHHMLLHANTPSELMGYEGQCASTYWYALSTILEDKVDFSHRVTQGAKDVVNASLNYGYAILYSRIQYHAVKAGLSVHISFLHALDDTKPTLVFDLIEEFRAFVVDRVVISMFNQLEPIKLDKEGKLTPKSRQRITQKVLEKLGSYTKHKRTSKKIDTIISQQTFMLARAIKGLTRYKPFIGKY